MSIYRVRLYMLLWFVTVAFGIARTGANGGKGNSFIFICIFTAILPMLSICVRWHLSHDRPFILNSSLKISFRGIEKSKAEAFKNFILISSFYDYIDGTTELF